MQARYEQDIGRVEVELSILLFDKTVIEVIARMQAVVQPVQVAQPVFKAYPGDVGQFLPPPGDQQQFVGYTQPAEAVLDQPEFGIASNGAEHQHHVVFLPDSQGLTRLSSTYCIGQRSIIVVRDDAVLRLAVNEFGL